MVHCTETEGAGGGGATLTAAQYRDMVLECFIDAAGAEREEEARATVHEAFAAHAGSYDAPTREGMEEVLNTLATKSATGFKKDLFAVADNMERFIALLGRVPR